MIAFRTICVFMFLTVLAAICMPAAQANVDDCSIPVGRGFPNSVKKIVSQDLQYLTSIGGTEGSPMHQALFKSQQIDGRAYCTYLTKYIKTFEYVESSPEILANYSMGRVLIGEAYVKANRMLRLATLIHEASHGAPDTVWHASCPDPFYRLDGKLSSLSGSFSCDRALTGGYAIEEVWAANVSSRCLTCSVQEVLDLIKVKRDSAHRIIEDQSSKALETDSIQ